MQHRLNLCIQTKQNVHPRALVAFVIETMSSILQYYRTISKIWDSLYSKHQLRDSDITLDRVYALLSEFLIELKLNEDTQIVTGNSGTQMKPSAYVEYVNASKVKIQPKGKGKGGEGKGGKQNWRLPSNDYWKPEGCQHGHHCPRYHPGRQPGRNGKKGKGKKSKSKGKSDNLNFAMMSPKSMPTGEILHGLVRTTSSPTEPEAKKHKQQHAEDDDDLAMDSFHSLQPTDPPYYLYLNINQLLQRILKLAGHVAGPREKLFFFAECLAYSYR